jgi:hypothetical protein
MIRTKYRGYLITQQREFGPLKLLEWVEDGVFIVTKDNVNAMPGVTFRNLENAKKAIDAHVDVFEHLKRNLC